VDREEEVPDRYKVRRGPNDRYDRYLSNKNWRFHDDWDLVKLIYIF
jgi:hypothetical protein